MLQSCSKLKHLAVHMNALAVLPSSLYDLENLESLDASFNQIVQIPQEMKKVKKLQRRNVNVLTF